MAVLLVCKLIMLRSHAQVDQPLASLVKVKQATLPAHEAGHTDDSPAPSCLDQIFVATYIPNTTVPTVKATYSAKALNHVCLILRRRLCI